MTSVWKKSICCPPSYPAVAPAFASWPDTLTAAMAVSRRSVGCGLPRKEFKRSVALRGLGGGQKRLQEKAGSPTPQESSVLGENVQKQQAAWSRLDGEQGEWGTSGKAGGNVNDITNLLRSVCGTGFKRWELQLRIFGPMVFSVVFVVGLVGNGLVVAVLGRRRCPWLLADCYLFQLAVADVLLVLSLPFWAAQFTRGWIFEEGLCKLLGALTAMNSYSTVFLLACISMERYLVIVHAVQLYHRRKLLHTYLVLGQLPPGGRLLGSPQLREFHFRTVFFIPSWGHPSAICFETQEAVVRFGINASHLFLLASCCRVLVCVFLPRQRHLERDCAQENVLDYGLLVTQSLGLAHCCLNPLVYAFVGVKFRRELSELWHRRDGSEGHRPNVSNGEYSQPTEHTAAQGIDYYYSTMM
ncbi:C-X-C chemokine receptor type 3-like [Sphaerodactylus townsendi]|uniref:C-X-C chemokine receptor type 3-like n=1 Tax=Sphaerodactylus townsendi TaxID=933632 RepID=UPI002026E46D|nr:C-X-C chemokine receptor type 3-like [Sphaerodactylus townsendi]